MGVNEFLNCDKNKTIRKAPNNKNQIPNKSQNSILNDQNHLLSSLEF